MNGAATALSEIQQDLDFLGSYNPDAKALQRLGRRARKLHEKGGLKADIRIRVISSYLTDMLADGLIGSLLRRNIFAEVELSPYGSLPLELMGNAPEADLYVILPSFRDLTRNVLPGSSRDEAEEAAYSEASFWASLWPESAPVVQMMFDPPPVRILAEADGYTPGGLLNHVRLVNRALSAIAGSNVALVDAEHLASTVGSNWHCPRTYALCKQPFTGEAIGEISEALAASVAGIVGKSKKVLVLDLDNTLWGGVIGDVGTKGIVLGMETAEGEAFVRMQQYAKDLSKRGIILAVCSKNQESIAQDPFLNHSAMILKTEDIAVFVANFDEKAGNIRAISKSLNVGLDSIVFVDDNPIERKWVASQLPEVTVIDLPEDPAHYVEAIELSRCFPIQKITKEDLHRSKSYQAKAAFSKSASNSSDIDGFLRELSPTIFIDKVGDVNLDRAVQLVGKTNQFKISKKTFSETDILNYNSYCFSFKDNIQDYGIISVLIFEVHEGCLEILQWVMSCRVFGRRIEFAICDFIKEYAKIEKIDKICLKFEMSEKNSVSLGYLQSSGFSGTNSVLNLDPQHQSKIDHFITIEKKS